MLSPELGLDLGWCIARPLSEAAQARIRRVKTYPRIEAVLAEYAGLRRHQFKALPIERRDELYLAHLWMMRQFDPPMIGVVVEAQVPCRSEIGRFRT